MLIYLNRTGFNGLFRLNGDGGFNVPAGRYVRPRILEPDHIHAISGSCRAAACRLRAPGSTPCSARRGQATSCPSIPRMHPSTTARFTAYTMQPFTLGDHQRLADVAAEARAARMPRDGQNSSAPEIAALYEGDPAAAGLRVHRLPARRAINSRAAARGVVTELLLNELEPRD